MMRLSVIIPAYNEEKRLPKTLAEIDNYLSAQSYDYEILVVDNGSSDATPQIVRNLSQTIRGLKLIEGLAGHAKGYAVRVGMLGASGDFRIFTDADNSTSIDQIEKMWPEFSAQGGSPPEADAPLEHAPSGEKGFDVVIGSRDVKGAVLAQPQPPWRWFLGEVFNLVVQVFSGLFGIPDTQCGFKGFSAKAANDIFHKTTIDGWAFDVEVLVLARKLGYKIKQIPVVWINDPHSKVKFLGMIKMLFEVMRIRWNIIRHRYG